MAASASGMAIAASCRGLIGFLQTPMPCLGPRRQTQQAPPQQSALLLVVGDQKNQASGEPVQDQPGNLFPTPIVYAGKGLVHQKQLAWSRQRRAMASRRFIPPLRAEGG